MLISSPVNSINPYWTPKDGSCNLWYDASDISTVSVVGNSVSEWRPKYYTTLNNKLTQPLVGRQPTFNINRIEFRGTYDDGPSTTLNDEDYLVFDSPQSIYRAAVVIDNVYKSFDNVSGGWFVAQILFGKDQIRFFYRTAGHTGTGDDFQLVNGGSDSNPRPTIRGRVSDSLTWITPTDPNRANRISIFNGSLVPIGPQLLIMDIVDKGNFDNLEFIHLGVTQSNATSYVSSYHDIMEILIWDNNTTITEDEWQQTINYLGRKHSLTVASNNLYLGEDTRL